MRNLNRKPLGINSPFADVEIVSASEKCCQDEYVNREDFEDVHMLPEEIYDNEDDAPTWDYDDAEYREDDDYDHEDEYDDWMEEDQDDGEDMEWGEESTLDDVEIRALLNDHKEEGEQLIQDYGVESETDFEDLFLDEVDFKYDNQFSDTPVDKPVETSESTSNEGSEFNVSPSIEHGIFDQWSISNKWSELLKKAQSIVDRVRSRTFTGLSNIPGEHSIGFVLVKIKGDDGVFRKKELSLHSRVKDDISFYKEASEWREKFTLLDYPYAGKIGTVKARSNRQSRFGRALYLDGAIVRFNEASHTLTIDGLPGFKVTTGSMADPTEDRLPKLSKGRYKLLFPAYPSKYGAEYLPLTEYARVWFQIEDEYVGTDKGRYLHPGKVSHSCITVGENFSGNPNNAHGSDEDIKKWTTIYNHLIARRINHKYVGELIIS